MKFKSNGKYLFAADAEALKFIQDTKGEVEDLRFGQHATTRTLRQNNALHQWFTELADELNARGLDMKTFLKPGIEIPWNQDRVKEFIWRPVQKAMFKIDSTTDLETSQIDEIYKVISRKLLDNDIHIDFPSLR